MFSGMPNWRIKEDRGLRPNIEGLPKDVVKDVVRVLGVMIHYRLRWSPHVDYVRGIWFFDYDLSS